MSEMKSLRRKIDRLDKLIVRLLNRRAKYADEIGKIKDKLGLDVYSPDREKQVYENVSRQNPGPLTDEAVKRVYERIIDESRRLERESAEERRTSIQTGKSRKLFSKEFFRLSDKNLNGRKNVILLFASALLLMSIVWLIAFVTPYHNARGKGILVTIQRGMTANQVYTRLAEDRVISNTLLFKLFGRISSIQRSIKAGKYLFTGHYSDYDVLKLIATGKSNLLVHVTIPEGMTVRQIAGIYQHELGVDSAAFAGEALGDSMAAALDIPSQNLEGYLFPETYDFYYGTDPEEIIKRMTDEFRLFFSDSLRTRAAALGYSVDQIVTVASIVEAEAQIDSERPIIASVYYNRLKKRIPLEADPTIEYALGRHTRIYYKDLQIKSPYNTYKRYGLPPTPICNPGMKSIMAALYPDTTKYLYFVATGRGGHRFSVTFQEHKRAIRAYRRSMMRE
ncbi:MAG TPA: endolytic transglycosylase MltG [Candidatus Kryptobacter bacterium]|nr:endolytic transglycosylase MltG [Candidatus Kryptobacter bacterium]